MVFVFIVLHEFIVKCEKKIDLGINSLELQLTFVRSFQHLGNALILKIEFVRIIIDIIFITIPFETISGIRK